MKTMFDDEITLEDMTAGMDLSYIHWNGNSFNNQASITSNNKDFEFNPIVVSYANELSIVWQQNSENDSFGFTGTNSIYRKQLKEGVWQNAETIADELSIVNSIDTAYSGSNNVIAYTSKVSSDTSTIEDLELFYSDGIQTTRLTNDTTPDYSVHFLNDELYWIAGNSIVSITNGNMNSKTTVVSDLVSNISMFKVIKNEEGKKSVVWQEENDSSMTFYSADFDHQSNEFGVSSPIVASNGVVRGWDACMLSNGQIELAYAFAEYLNEPINGVPYGNLKLIQRTAEKFNDISVNPYVWYDGEIKPNEEIKIYADVYNSGSLPVEQFNINIIDEANNIIKTKTIDQSLAVGERVEIEIPFTLPNVITRSDYKIDILPSRGNDISLLDNEAIFSFGFADLAIVDSQKVRTSSGWQLAITAKNQGHDTISGGDIKLQKDGANGEIFDSQEFSELEPNAEIIITFDIDDSNLNFGTSEFPELIYILAETADEESDFSNNSKEIFIYPDYTIAVIEGTTGGTAHGSGVFENNTLAVISAQPQTGYLFDGWYENDKLLYGAAELHTVKVSSNRLFEARFKPNDLLIANIDIYGSFVAGEELCITALTEGGASSKKQWEFYVYYEGAMYYTDDNSALDFFYFTPLAAGTYTVVANAIDETGFKATRTQQFNVV